MPIRVFAAAAALLGADPELKKYTDNASEFIAGLIFGLIQKDDLNYIQACLTDGQNLEQQIQQAVDDL